MSLRTFETEILNELRSVTGRKTLRLKDIMEWSTGEVTVFPEETKFRLPKSGVNCVVKTEVLGKRSSPKKSS